MKTKRKVAPFAATLITIGSLAGGAMGQVIDFETLTDGSTTPTDNAQLDRTLGYSFNYNGLSNQVTFGFDSDGDLAADANAVFEEVGPTDFVRGFARTVPSTVDDTARPGNNELKSFFLRGQDPFTPAGDTFTLNHDFVISYANPVAALSGQIWDIDRNSNGKYEQWGVNIYNAGGTLLDSLDSPVGLDQTSSESLDGLPWTFSFDRSGVNEVSTVEIYWKGDKLQNIGLAFDNFNATQAAVPEPSSALLLGFGGLGLMLRRRR